MGFDRTLTLALVLVTLTGLWPQQAEAHRRVLRKRSVLSAQPQPRRWLAPDPRVGPTFGLGLIMTDTVDRDTRLTDALQQGTGFAVSAGFRFAPAFALEGSWERSWFDPGPELPISETGVLDGLRFDLLVYPFTSSQRFEPFLDLGFGFYRYERRDWDVLSSELTGIGFQLGGGLALRLSRNLSLVGRVLYRGVEMDNTDYEPALYEERAWFHQWTGEAGVRITF